MTFRRKDARSIVITISASCERNMVGTVSKQFLKECMENEETGMTDLRIEIEKLCLTGSVLMSVIYMVGNF